MSERLASLKHANEITAQYRRISVRQSFAMLLCAENGTSVLFLSGLLGGRFGLRGWLVIVLGGVLSLLCAALIAAAYRKTEAKSAEELFSAAFGSVGAAAVLTLFRLYSLLRSAFCIGVFTCFVKGLLFPDAPFWLISFSITAAVCAILPAAPPAIARLSELSVLFLGVVLLSLTTCLPLAQSTRIWAAVLNPSDFRLPLILFCASGPEMLLWHAPILSRGKTAGSILLSTTGRIGVFLLVLSVFGSAALRAYPWPIVTMFRGGDLAILQHPELLLLICFTMISLSPAYLFSAAALPCEKKKTSVGLLLLCGALLFSAAGLVNSTEKIPQAAEAVGILFAAFGLFLPLLLVLFGRKRNEKSVRS